MKAGLTSSLTGECQPKRTFPATASRTFMPRVGTTEIFIVPVSISMMVTPSWRPPCNIRRLTEKGLSRFTPSSWLVIRQSCGAFVVSSSTQSFAKAGMVPIAALRPIRDIVIRSLIIALSQNAYTALGNRCGCGKRRNRWVRFAPLPQAPECGASLGLDAQVPPFHRPLEITNREISRLRSRLSVSTNRSDVDEIASRVNRRTASCFTHRMRAF